METRKTTIERAFELAQSGKYATTTEIRQVLHLEGHNLSQLEGPSLTRQLRELIKTSLST